MSSLYIYPVKGLRGIELAESNVEAAGLRYDRRWMLVDDDGLFVSQRTNPKMCRLHTEVDSTCLVIHSPFRSIGIPVDRRYPRRLTVTVWRSTLEAEHVCPEIDEWFSEELGQSVRLVRLIEDVPRPTNPEFSRDGDHVSFADGYPILVVSEASLNDLNSRLDTPLPMNRFRPNIVIEGCGPFGEDQWTGFRVASQTYRIVKPCGRCQVTTTDQDTGLTGQEPLRTLATYRRGEDGKVYFGVNVIPDGESMIRVGDQITPRRN